MAKDSGSTRIPRFDTMNGNTTSRIPLPGSLRIQQNHIVPPTGLIQPTKIISTTKIARPSSLTGLKPPISTIAALKKSLTSEKFTEAANLVTQKTTTVVRKFLTKPEKSEKNIETKAIIEKQQERTNTNLEKGSKESSNEKLSDQTISLEEKRAQLTRSETFVRDDNMSSDFPNSTSTDMGNTYEIHDDELSVTNVINSTKIDNRTQRYSLFEVPHDMVQSTPARPQNVTKILDKSKISCNVSINRTQVLKPATPISFVNATKTFDKSQGNAIKYFANSPCDYIEETEPLSPLKPLRRSDTYSQIPGNDNDPQLDRTYFNETEMYERLDQECSPLMNKTLTMADDSYLDDSNEYLEATLLGNLSDKNESVLNQTLIMNRTITSIAPDKKDMKLQLNSTVPSGRLTDFTISPRYHLMNITKAMLDSPQFDLKNQTALLYMSPQTELKHSILAPRKANSRASLANSRASLAKTPDDLLELMEVDQYGNVFEIPPNVKQALSMNALQELKQMNKPRFSFGLDLTESTLDCSIELCDVSLASNAASASTGGNNLNSSGSNAQIASPGQLLRKQNSFDLDESLGILTPDQMKEFLDSTTTNNTNNLDLPGLVAHNSAGAIMNFCSKGGSKLSLQQMRIDLTPSPEDLPLDPVDVNTDMDTIMSLPPHNNNHQSSSSSASITQSQIFPNSHIMTYTELSQTDTDSKTDQMTKSNTSKVSTSFITSVTSITSLDNGYQGDGEMSRPASRGGDHSPSNGPKSKNQISRQPSFNNQHQNIPVRRQDPMTDSDFFTESDADVDIFHRGDRRAQVIDGQLYGPMHQQTAANVFITEQPEMEDSCMESSGIFTDVENRCDDDIALSRRDAIESAAAAEKSDKSNESSPNSLAVSVTTSGIGETDMSPDGSTDTVKSNKNENNPNKTVTSNSNNSHSDRSITPSSLLSQGQCCTGIPYSNSGNLLTDSQTSTINSSFSLDTRMSITTDYQPAVNLNTTIITTQTVPTQLETTTTTIGRIFNVRSSPTSNATSPTTIYSRSITEKRAATSPLLNTAKIKAPNKPNTTTTMDYTCIGGGRNEMKQKTKIFTNSFKSNTKSPVSVKKSSPSRKHVLTTIASSSSSSVRPSSISLLSSSPSPSPTSYLNKNKNQIKSITKSNKINSNSGNNNNRKSKNLNFGSSLDCQSPCSSASLTSVMVLNNVKNNSINGINIKTKNTVNKRNISNQENINQNDTTIITTATATSSNNSSSLSISTGSVNISENNLIIQSPQHSGINNNNNNNSNNTNTNNCNNYRTTKFPPNKWDAVMNKITENKNNQSKLINKKNYNQVKSKVATGVTAAVMQQNNQNGIQKKIPNLNNSSNSSSFGSNNRNALIEKQNNGAAIIHDNSMKIKKSEIIKNKKIIINSSTPNSSINSSFDCSSISGLTSPQTKRLIQGAIKRGRSYSKDSQQSSQSDLSLSGGSPKIIIKNSARSAKKRDVRNLTISPSDLGPPPKTQTPVTTPNGVNRMKIISTNSIQKRSSPIPSQTNLSQQNNKNSPPPKKATPRRILDTKILGKTPLKDHNRLIGQQQQQQQQQHQNGNTKINSNTLNGSINRIKENNSTVIVTTNTPLSVCNGNSPTSVTKLRNGNSNGTTTTTANTVTPPSISNNGSPNNTHKKHLQSQQSGQQNKSQLYQKQQKLQQQHQQQQQEQLQKEKEKSELQQHEQQLNTTQNISKSSLLDLSIPEGNKTVEALGVLLQYLVYDLDAFACPSIKQGYQNSRQDLLQTQTLLDNARTSCLNLQDQLLDKEHFYMTREQELQALHRCELTKVESSLIDIQTNAKERIAVLQSDLNRKDEEHIKKFEVFQQESELKIQQLEKDLARARSNESDLLKRVEILTTNEHELRDRIQETEDSFTERLQATVQRERELNDRITLLVRQLEHCRLEAEKRERELEEKLNLSQNELTVIRNNQSILNNTNLCYNNDEVKLKSPKNVHGNGMGMGMGMHHHHTPNVMSLSMSSSNSSNKVQMLENEVESLRSVMDIKLNDICELRKKNQELIRANEEFEALKIKYSGMESRLEDLQLQLRSKDEEKQELMTRIKHLQETCAQEAKNRTRVVLHNEELQYRLKQNSEKFNALVAELSKAEHTLTKGQADGGDLSQNSSLMSNSSMRSFDIGGGAIPGLTFEEDNESPPGSPIIKGVVKKSDSVSWVLQMDDELPEVVASRMVKRAGSFRSSFNEKNQHTKRQLSLPCGPGSLNGTNHSIHSNNSPAMNPLQQSASATMISPQNQTVPVSRRQHSNSESEYGTISTPRVRSKSVIIKGCDLKKQLKQNPMIIQSKKMDTSWKEPICSSSPYARHPMKFQKTSHSPPKVSSLAANVTKQLNKTYSQDKIVVDDTDCNGSDGARSNNDSPITAENIFRRNNSRNLITCDTTALTTNERLEMRQSVASSTAGCLPSHASVQDLKVLKKSQQQIQESAGEAMVSGTNSEDESCSASSDEQSQSTNSDTTSSLASSSASDQQHKLLVNSLGIEDALLIDNLVNSLDGTPMEVSWSSDAAEPPAYQSESIV